MKILRFLYALIKYIFIGEHVTSEEYSKRISICNSCKHLNKNKCGLCGCYVNNKSKWSTESCPINKW